MSDKNDKPNAQDIDPEATVTFQRSSLTAPPVDEDATVAIQRSSLTEAPAADEDATVMMQPIKASPESATSPASESPVAVDEDATVMMAPIRSEDVAAATPSPAAAPAPARSSESEFDPDATNIAPIVAPPSPPPAPPAPAPQLPWNAIAGGVVVLLVVLYFVFSGDKASPPPAPKAEVAASPAPTTAPAPAAPAAEAAPAAAPAATAAAPAVAKSEAPAPAAPTAPAPEKATAPASAGSVKSLLAAEIKRGQVTVSEDAGVTTISLRDPHQFDAGGVDPEARLRPILQGVAAALDKVPGMIVVTGHADTSPSTDSRYPTNKELSAARAESAAKVLAAKLRDPSRVKSEGASDAQPLVPNDSAANRARNRRVVIVLKPAA